MGTAAIETCVFDDPARLLAIGQAGEFGVSWGAELDGFDAEPGHVFEESGEVAVLDALAVGVGLAADRETEGFGVEGEGGGGGRRGGEEGAAIELGWHDGHDGELFHNRGPGAK